MLNESARKSASGQRAKKVSFDEIKSRLLGILISFVLLLNGIGSCPSEIFTIFCDSPLIEISCLSSPKSAYISASPEFAKRVVGSFDSAKNSFKSACGEFTIRSFMLESLLLSLENRTKYNPELRMGNFRENVWGLLSLEISEMPSSGRIS